MAGAARESKKVCLPCVHKWLPDKDIMIEYTGLKTGEKLTEILSSANEELTETQNEKLMLVHNGGPGTISLDQIDEFIKSVRNLTDEEVKEGIQRIVTEYQIGATGL